MASKRPRDAMGRFLPKDEEGAAEPANEADEAQAGQRSGGETETVDISDTVAPSIGPHTTVTRPVHSEPVAHEQSDVDAMGLDKRREVVGKSYGPSAGRQLTMYGIFLAVLAALVFGGKMLADELDKPPEPVEDQAVWTGNDEPPTQIDFRPNGNIPTEGP